MLYESIPYSPEDNDARYLAYLRAKCESALKQAAIYESTTIRPDCTQQNRLQYQQLATQYFELALRCDTLISALESSPVYA